MLHQVAYRGVQEDKDPSEVRRPWARHALDQTKSHEIVAGGDDWDRACRALRGQRCCGALRNYDSRVLSDQRLRQFLKPSSVTLGQPEVEADILPIDIAECRQLVAE